MDATDNLAERLAGLIASADLISPVVVEYRRAAISLGLTTTGPLTHLLRMLSGRSADRARPDRAVFLDIETTGLNAGAGTLVFLVGLAFVEGTDVVVEQYFLHEPAAEPALLGQLARRLSDFRSMVTFNGKSFDAPLLIGRYDLHRLADPLPGAHVDLLHPSRRIWGRRLGHSTLGALEARILGVTRDRDVPGAEVPRLYFDFIRGGSVAAMASVLSHNRDDLLAMVALAERLDLLLGDPRRAESSGSSDLLGLGMLFESVHQRGEARHCYAAALVGATTAERGEALFRLASLVDKVADLERAIDLFTMVANYSFERAVLASIELAKIYEHRTGDHDQALAYAERALALLATASPKRRAGLSSSLTRRIARLQRKVNARSSD